MLGRGTATGPPMGGLAGVRDAARSDQFREMQASPQALVKGRPCHVGDLTHLCKYLATDKRQQWVGPNRETEH